MCRLYVTRNINGIFKSNEMLDVTRDNNEFE
jgi:hypothetical protein